MQKIVGNMTHNEDSVNYELIYKIYQKIKIYFANTKKAMKSFALP